MKTRWPLALLVITSCGGSTGSGTSSSSSGSSGNPPVTLPDGGTVPALSCGDENVTAIAGTWDIIGTSSDSAQSAATMTVTDSAFSFAANGRSLTFAAAGGNLTLTWQDNGKNVPITTTHDGATPLDLGLMPLALGGAWTFASTTNGESCTASLGGNGFNATCNGVNQTPFGELKGTLVGQRTQTLSSIFGSLGGVWHLAADGGGGADATISGNTFTASIDGRGQPGWVTVKVCNGKASGITSGGFEFSATKQ